MHVGELAHHDLAQVVRTLDIAERSLPFRRSGSDDGGAVDRPTTACAN